jgi:hypothetical protein
MLLVAPILVAAALALLFGGSFYQLAQLRIRHSPLLFGSLFIQVAIYFPMLRHAAFVTDHAALIYLGALSLALLGMASNWGLGLPLRIALLGLALNASVIAANGAHMPVDAAALRAVLGPHWVAIARDPHTYTNTRLADRASRLLLLSDRLPVTVPGYGGNVYSVGDVLIALGVGTLVFTAMRTRPALPPAPQAA